METKQKSLMCPSDIHESHLNPSRYFQHCWHCRHLWKPQDVFQGKTRTTTTPTSHPQVHLCLPRVSSIHTPPVESATKTSPEQSSWVPQPRRRLSAAASFWEASARHFSCEIPGVRFSLNFVVDENSLNCSAVLELHWPILFYFFAWKNTWNVGRWVSRELCQHWAQTYIYTLRRLYYWASDPGRVCKRRFLESLLSNNGHDRGFNSLLDSTMLVLFWGFTPGPGCHDGAPSFRKHVTVKARTRRGSVRLRRLDLWQDISQSVCLSGRMQTAKRHSICLFY